MTDIMLVFGIEEPRIQAEETWCIVQGIACMVIVKAVLEDIQPLKMKLFCTLLI